MTPLEEHPIHASVNRPHLFLGADRELALGVIAAAILLAVAFGSLLGLALSVVFCLVVLEALRRLAKEDPLMRRVYTQHLKYQGFYPAKSGVFAKRRKLPGKWN